MFCSGIRDSHESPRFDGSSAATIIQSRSIGLGSCDLRTGARSAAKARVHNKWKVKLFISAALVQIGEICMHTGDEYLNKITCTLQLQGQ